jgi:DNA-directed RNA polymerase subunit RPC12/RpoP
MDKTRQFPCGQCGADLKFEPGVQALSCPYCGFSNPIPVIEDNVIEEKDYYAFLQQAQSAVEMEDVITVKCVGCGSETTLDPNVTADECPFCSTSLVKTGSSHKLIKPEALLPFKIRQKEAQDLFRSWLGSLWFAPNKLQAFARSDHGLNGVYIPHWTYDTNTVTNYTGERGEHYYVTVTRTDSDGNEYSDREQRTNWYYTSGTVYNDFDDLVVPATRSLPETPLHELEPWDTTELVAYDDAYLSGFRSESYQIGLEDGFNHAKRLMSGPIDSNVRNNIGGDEQRVHSTNTQYNNITFKHILLPIWISAYKYQGKTFQFLINARTGEVQGERPWSWVKITLAVIAAIIVIIVMILIFSKSK